MYCDITMAATVVTILVKEVVNMQISLKQWLLEDNYVHYCKNTVL